MLASGARESLFTSQVSIVRVILQHCLSQTPWLVDEAQPDGLTALHLAALHGHLEVSDLLLQSGANPNCAVVNRPPGVLLASASAPSSTRADGSMRPSACAVFTPLHLAVHKAHPDVVCLLLCYGARAAGRGSANGDCRSPMQLALTTLAQTHDIQAADYSSVNDIMPCLLHSPQSTNAHTHASRRLSIGRTEGHRIRLNRRNDSNYGRLTLVDKTSGLGNHEAEDGPHRQNPKNTFMG
ncbi:hypothetical protein AHF37_10753 [Paragonimus kellicotti]|nr:hypothetical protein AHF37_10753 [Paragonimus kellicotti]